MATSDVRFQNSQTTSAPLPYIVSQGKVLRTNQLTNSDV